MQISYVIFFAQQWAAALVRSCRSSNASATRSDCLYILIFTQMDKSAVFLQMFNCFTFQLLLDNLFADNIRQIICRFSLQLIFSLLYMSINTFELVSIHSTFSFINFVHQKQCSCNFVRQGEQNK
ncbi:Hypothetical_protein [Hexamita inflata]|uniref:Hypothetical_protein n=1 Tax=Hexamita inflata TaxID=28002 RepID=A0ABP1I7B1_9EUKA